MCIRDRAGNLRGIGIGDAGRGRGALTDLADLGSSNPFLDRQYNAAAGRVTDSFNTDILPSLNATFSAAGRTGSPAHIQAASQAAGKLTDSLSGLSADLYGGAYDADRQRQLAAGRQLHGEGLRTGLGATEQQLRAGLGGLGSAHSASGQVLQGGLGALQAGVNAAGNQLQGGLSGLNALLGASGQQLQSGLGGLNAGLGAAGQQAQIGQWGQTNDLNRDRLGAQVDQWGSQNALQGRSIDNQFTLGQGGLANQSQQIANQFTLGQGGLDNQAAQIANQGQQIANQLALGQGGLDNQSQQIANQLRLGLGGLDNQSQQIHNNLQLGAAGLVPALRGIQQTDLNNLLAAGNQQYGLQEGIRNAPCLLYTSPSPRDRTRSRMPSSA